MRGDFFCRARSWELRTGAGPSEDNCEPNGEGRGRIGWFDRDSSRCGIRRLAAVGAAARVIDNNHHIDNQDNSDDTGDNIDHRGHSSGRLRKRDVRRISDRPRRGAKTRRASGPAYDYASRRSRRTDITGTTASRAAD